MTTGLSDLDSLLAELEDVDDPKKKKVQPPKKQQQPLDFGKEWDELDALVEKFEQDGKKLDEFEASTTPVAPSKPTPTQTTSTAPPPSKPRTQSNIPANNNAPPKQQPTTTTNLNQSKPPQKTSPPMQQPKNQDDSKVGGSFLLKRTTEPAPRQSLAPSEVKFCAKCGQAIGKEHIIALGMGWHPEHFTCDSCGKILKGDFFDNEGQYICKECTDRSFRCSTCQRTIDGEYFILGSDKYHKECYQAVKCAKCGLGITGSEMIALDRHYHSECFTCTRCNVKLPARFFSKGNQPYCEQCANSIEDRLLCGKCKLVVTGSYVSFENVSYHEHCFTCGHCYKSLNVEGFFTVGGKPHCGDCAKVLTGRA